MDSPLFRWDTNRGLKCRDPSVSKCLAYGIDIVRVLETLAIFHYELGLIGRAEYEERIEIADWLSRDSTGKSIDPRIDAADSEEAPFDNEKPKEYEGEAVEASIRGTPSNPNANDDDWIQFLCLGVWVFTKSDPDPYPSIPHGHYQSKNRAWPKLNPYTGRVFSSKHQEDPSQRLSKSDMKNVWRDEKFRSFCREMIIWYQEQYPHFKFGVRWPRRLPRW